MKVDDGDIVEFIGISWDEPQWEFDYPSVILKPIIKYSSSGTSCDTMIENMAIDLCCEIDLEDDNIEDEFKWRGWDLSRLNRVVRERLNGKDTWKTKIRNVIKTRLQFYKDPYGEMQYKILDILNK